MGLPEVEWYRHSGCQGPFLQINNAAQFFPESLSQVRQFCVMHFTSRIGQQAQRSPTHRLTLLSPQILSCSPFAATTGEDSGSKVGAFATSRHLPEVKPSTATAGPVAMLSEEKGTVDGLQ